MNSAIRYPLFLQEEMKKENPVVDGEFQRQESNPFFSLFDAMNHKTWGVLYWRKNPIGNHQVILTATTEKMRAIKDKYYYPNNSLLIIAGAIKNDDALAKAKAIYSDWKPSEFDPFQKWPIPEFAPLDQKDSLSFVVINNNARVPILAMNWRGPDTRKDIKNTIVADVFSFILSQKNSKFQKNLVDSGYALQANINYNTQKYVGPIGIVYVPNPAKFKNAFHALQHQIDQFDADDYFTDEQLETSKIQLANQDKFGKEVTSNYAHTLSFWWSSASLDYYFGYVDEIKKITRQDIKEYVRKYIKGQTSVKGLLLSPSMQKNWQVTDLDAMFK